MSELAERLRGRKICSEDLWHRVKNLIESQSQKILADNALTAHQRKMFLMVSDRLQRDEESRTVENIFYILHIIRPYISKM